MSDDIENDELPDEAEQPADETTAEPDDAEDTEDGDTFPRAYVEQLRDSGVTEHTRVLFICRSGHRSIGAAEAATAAGISQAFNVLDGFEGGLDENDHRGNAGWRALNLPWRQS